MNPGTENKKVIKSSEQDKSLDLNTQLELKEASLAPKKLLGQKVVNSKLLKATEKAESIIEQAKLEAEEIKNKARALYSKIESVIAEKKEEGFQQGREEGLESVTELLLKNREEHQKILDHLEQDAVELVFEIAQKIIGEAFATDKQALVGMIHQGLMASMGSQITLFVSPQDYKGIQEHQQQLMSHLHANQVLTIKPRDDVSENACVIESEMGTVEANLENQLKIIGKILGAIE